MGAWILSGCSAAGALNALEPQRGVATQRGIAYAAGPRRDLDVYRPTANARGAAVIVFFYGGGWVSGEKSQYAFVGRALARRGFVVVIPNYRLYPSARYPAFLEDCALAVRWSRDHAASLGGDPRLIFLLGHSAGAYNAAMLALDPRWLAAVGLDPRRDLRGVAGLAGPYDFLPLRSAELRAIFGAEGQTAASQPVNHVRSGAPPMLLAHDLGDKVVWPLNSERLAARLQAAGDEVRTRYYSGLSHALMIGAFAAPLRPFAPVLSDVAAFVRLHAQAQPGEPHETS